MSSIEIIRMFWKWKITVEHECICGCLSIDGYHNRHCCCVKAGAERARPPGSSEPHIDSVTVDPSQWRIFASPGVRLF